MKQTFIIMLVLCALASCDKQNQAVNYHVIPQVAQLEYVADAPFTLTANTQIVYAGGDDMRRNAEFLASYVQTATGKLLDIRSANETDTKPTTRPTIWLDANTKNDGESYELKVSAKGVNISGEGAAGVFYGIQTLRKSLPPSFRFPISLPAVSIEDRPYFSYRGVHLDVARHAFTMDEIKRFIDMMVLHNMNKLHWHLTDDQGWRIEIKKYPRLSEISSKRKETVIKKNSGRYDGVPYSAFYTQEEAKEIVAYAAKRHITVIPEIDLPGHMQAVLAAYPEFGCTGGPYEVWTMWGISEDVLCVGNNAAITFLEDVLTELVEIFPSKYIHLGADECPKTRWENCHKCQTKIKEVGIVPDANHSSEEYLQSYVIKHLEKHLLTLNRHMIGWDEILEGTVSETATVMAWRGEEWGIEAAKLGNNVIMTPTTALYFNYHQVRDTDHEPFGIGGYIPLEKVYNYEPMPASLSAEEKKCIIGVQANHWSEYFPEYAILEYMALPRWAALAELQWNVERTKNYPDFCQRLIHFVKFYDKANYNYSKHIFDVDVAFQYQPDASLKVTLNTIDNASVYYTLDGTDPTEQSLLYKDSLRISESCTFKATAIRPDGISRMYAEEITLSKASSAKIELLQPLSEEYQFSGVSGLIDGLSGGSNYKTGRWLGFIGNDLEVVLKLDTQTEVSSVAFNTYIETVDWIFDARKCHVSVSTDGIAYTTVASEEYAAMQENYEVDIHRYQLDFTPTEAKYVKVLIGSEHSIPDWHSGSGFNGFLFVDELSVN